MPPKSRKCWADKVLFPQEDEAIAQMVSELGDKCWTTLAAALQDKFGIKGRSGKQCRERWHNHLDPSIDRNPWTMDEERVIAEAHRIYGNKWAHIARLLPGRTDNAVKNHFYSTVRRNIRHMRRAERKAGAKFETVTSCHIDPNQLFQDALLKKELATKEDFHSDNTALMASTPCTNSASKHLPDGIICPNPTRAWNPSPHFALPSQERLSISLLRHEGKSWLKLSH